METIDQKSPVHTLAELTDRMASLVGNACREQLWVALFDAGDVQLPTLCPIEDPPEEPDEIVPNLVSVFASVIGGDAPGGSLVFVRERFGSTHITETDRRWERALSAAAKGAGVRMRAVFLSHPDGVVPIAVGPEQQ